MKYSIYLSEEDKRRLEYEVVSQDLRVYLTRLIERNLDFAKNGLINRNWLVNRSRTLAGKTIYVLSANDWGDYENFEYAWHNGEFELCLRRLDTPGLIELLCETLEHGWLDASTLNQSLEQEDSSFRFRQEHGDLAVDVFSIEQLEEDAPDVGEHPNIRVLVKRMDTGLESKDYSAVLHASASIFETLAKHIVGTSSIQNQSLGSFFARYQRDSQLPPELQAKVIAVYNARNTTPLAGHGSTETPTLTVHEAVTLTELTKAFVRIEYILQTGAESIS
ncbi:MULTISPECIES: hypothetical protein [Cyanophyceae]|uniref:hypothetical protein n=1 Tax=Cyanophyceae TaxID=3028117 RepID=UPI00168773BF|nr:MULTISPECIES: hypothetical protein [Cyanophyceae]MBD1915611.1 hypothetical protein [Phormidium sp. FACHB-77]MBD2031921.1 hypothetical protein [Phormidium sp. FACHB-322]MBD2050671.1 hypothetical protein [Leptolyngbya sp. FACHB-60]